MRKRILTLAIMATLVFGLVACKKGNVIVANPGERTDSDVQQTEDFMNGFMDSAVQQTETSIDEYIEAEVGDIISFGHYEQDSDSTNGAEEIEWRILSTGKTPNGRFQDIIILSEYILDCKPYNEERRVDWESSSLYKWMHSTFLNSAFTAEEQAMIYSEYSGEKFFLLRESEIEQYFSSAEECRTEATQYAFGQAKALGGRAIDWWIESFDTQWDYVGYIMGSGGRIGTLYNVVGYSSSGNIRGVRPALKLRIDLEEN